MTSKHFCVKQINAQQIVYPFNTSTKIVQNKLLTKVVLDGEVEKYFWYFIFRWVKSKPNNGQILEVPNTSLFRHMNMTKFLRCATFFFFFAQWIKV